MIKIILIIMSEIKFAYNGNSIGIQAQSNEILNIVIDRFCRKANVIRNKIYFLYNGEILNENITVDKIKSNNENKKIIIVYDNINTDDNKNLKRSNEIICPECYKNIFMKIDNYKIKLNNCINKHNKTLLFEEFEESQIINLSKIICNNCKNNDMGNTYNNKFYKCLNCKMNICPICYSNHNKKHKIINYNEINNICDKHFDNYENYCIDCKKNICLKCFEDHNNHNIEYYGKLYISEEKVKEEEKELRKIIDKMNEDIEKIKLKLDMVKINIEKYYDIIKFINEKNNRNYEMLLNKREINDNNNIKNDIKEIINDDNINNKFKKIIDIYNKMELDEIIIRYKINKNDKEIKIFDSDFIENNRNKCKIIYEGKEYEIKERWKINNKFKNEMLEIKLKGINNITNMSYMFFGCSNLTNLPDISKWNTNNITNMSCTFRGCSNLLSLSDISKWNTNNVINMSCMFFGCSKLSNLPDISKWNTNNVINISGMFYECSNLSNLPDISKWNTNNVTNMYGIFRGCSNLSNLPDISKWNTNKATDMSGIFRGCSNLLSLPDISKWNTNNVTNMSEMFYECSNLSNLPDISKWNTNNVTKMSGMFYGCSKLTYIPSKFNK